MNENPKKATSNLDSKLLEIYERIKEYPVVKGGTVFIDTEREGESFVLCTGPDEKREAIVQTTLAGDFAVEDMATIFYMINEAFEKGIQIGLRESSRLAREHAAIRAMDEENTSQLDVLVEGLDTILHDIRHDSLEVGIVETVSFCHNNPNFTENTPFEDAKLLHIDYTSNEKGKDFDFSPENCIETIVSIWKNEKNG